MKLDKLNAWLTLVANVGVLLGILLVAFELRQNSLVVAAQTRSDLAEGTVEFLWRQIEHDDLRGAILRASSGETLSDEDTWLLVRHAQAALRRWENIHYQYRVGLYEEQEFSAQIETWKGLVRGNVIGPYWEILRNGYSPDFVEFIDELSSDSVPLGKNRGISR